MGLVFGFGGVRDFDGQLTIDPRLPARFRSLGFSIRFHDRQLRVQITHEHERFELTEGEPLEVTIRGRCHTLVRGAAVEIDRAPTLSGAGAHDSGGKRTLGPTRRGRIPV
jgi:alpha,alpha-trehalose phosphorylase